MKCLFPLVVNDTLVKCGKCFHCRQQYNAQWTTRMLHEAQQFDSSTHITLTYNGQNYHTSPHECKRDVQLFIKRLRRYFDRSQTKIRYYSVCEKGSLNGRLHHHCVIFGANSTSLERIIRTTKCWNKGFTRFTSFDRGPKAIARYVTNYVGSKKCEFRLMSKGIGKGYLTPQMVEFHRSQSDTFVVLPYTDGKKVPMPRYYYNKIFPSLIERNNRTRLYYKNNPDKALERFVIIWNLLALARNCDYKQIGDYLQPRITENEFLWSVHLRKYNTRL